jgi:hypothetical protein
MPEAQVFSPSMIALAIGRTLAPTLLRNPDNAREYG